MERPTAQIAQIRARVLFNHINQSNIGSTPEFAGEMRRERACPDPFWMVFRIIPCSWSLGASSSVRGIDLDKAKNVSGIRRGASKRDLVKRESPPGPKAIAGRVQKIATGISYESHSQFTIHHSNACISRRGNPLQNFHS